MVRVYLRRRQGTDGPFKATQGSAQRPREAWRGWSGARLRAPRRHRFPSARPGPTPTGGRRSARGPRARGGDATGRQGRGEPVGDGQAVGWLGLKEAGREGSSGFSAPAICWVVTRFSPRQEQPPGEGGGVSHPPTLRPASLGLLPGAVKPHGRGPPAACAPARRSLHDHMGAGEGRPGTEETQPLAGPSPPSLTRSRVRSLAPAPSHPCWP